MMECVSAVLRKTSALSSLGCETLNVAKSQRDEKMIGKVEDIVSELDCLCQQTNDVVLDIENEGSSQNLEEQVGKLLELIVEHEGMMKNLKATLDKL